MSDEREKLKLHHLRPAPGSKKSKIRVGRGESGKRGKTAGRGTKGLKARGKLRPGFEGGQTPLSMRLPKLPGFKNPNKEYFAIVNLETLNQFDAGTEVTVPFGTTPADPQPNGSANSSNSSLSSVGSSR